MELLLLALPLLLLVFLMTRQRGQMKQTQALQASLEVGQEVMTAAGMYGTITAVDGDVVTLETVPGQPSRWDRRAIVKVGPAPVDTSRDDATGTNRTEPPAGA